MNSKISSFFVMFFFFSFLNSCKTPQPVVPQEVAAPKEEVVPQPEIVEETEEEIVEEIIEEETLPDSIIVKEIDPKVPRAMREFRAAWVASVANINWPSKPGLSSKEQQQEAIALLDLLKENNFNAVILQVRPQAEAFYQSDLEPWSYFLTGEQGKAPSN